MIPHQLTIKNFLSYREATLNFAGLHVACVCGANGAGKSSLLEAIVWALWGESRAVTEDDVIHQGEMEAQVDFIFECHQQTYRVMRTRYRGQSSVLEFQVKTSTQFRSLTQRTSRATQDGILQHLKLDYDTFINSAYLRQGRADEFMLKRPAERKQILADLLKLTQYDEVAEKAKERSRQLKAELALSERAIASLDAQLQHEPALTAEQSELTERIAELQQQQTQDEQTLQNCQSSQLLRQTQQQQLSLQQQQLHHLQQECHRLQHELHAAQQQQQQSQSLLAQESEIVAGYTQLRQLQSAEEHQASQFQAHQIALAQRQHLQQQQADALAQIKDQMRHLHLQQDALRQQEQELHHILTKAEDVKLAATQLEQARSRLVELDRLQMQANPLVQHKHQLQRQLDRAQARLSARLEELQTLGAEIQTQQRRQPKLQQAVLEVSELVDYLENRRLYQQKVLEKGTERRTFMDRLQDRQREYELQLAELDQKIQLLEKAAESGEIPRESHQAAIADPDRTPTERSVHPSPVLSQPPCPLCDRPLDDHHRHLVLQRHRTQQHDIQSQIWVIREQLTTSDREIRVLRQEYRQLDKDLSHYKTVLEKHGQLQEQLQGNTDLQQRLQQLLQEQHEIERSLQTNHYAPDLHEELRLLEHQLATLNYDDKDHALARGEVDRWRWAEAKQNELKHAHQRLTQLTERQPQLATELERLEHQQDALHHSPEQQQMDALDRQLAEIAYDPATHTALRSQLRQAQGWELQKQELEQAQHRHPLLQARVLELETLLNDRVQAAQTLETTLISLQQTLAEMEDFSLILQRLQPQMQERRSHLDRCMAQLGRLQQQHHQLQLLKQQRRDHEQQIQTLRQQFRVHHELAHAFSKNGIQALMIENVLPQLEAEANHILGRLSNHQLHIHFVTQRAGRRHKSASKAPTKLIDTLDIFISDLKGTRSYETYSGGEAFRVNFAIRLALARLLAQRSGAALQLLIIDEGFGTQDELGCDRLIGAINAIAADFACILTVTHMPHLKEAFQTRIEIHKTEQGSQICLSA